jgi:hypothetical protein
MVTQGCPQVSPFSDLEFIAIWDARRLEPAREPPLRLAPGLLPLVYTATPVAIKAGNYLSGT